MKHYKVILADDHPIILMGIRHALHNYPHIDIVAEASDADSLVEQAKLHSPDLIITDYNMPGGRIGDGAKLIAHLQRYFPETRILVLTMISNPIILSNMIKSGIAGIVLKSANLDEVALALSSIKKGTPYFSHALQEMVAAYGLNNEQGSIESLSNKETEVLRLYLTGLSVSEIATQLSRSIKTISAQKRAAMTKLGVETDKDLFEYAIKNELI